MKYTKLNGFWLTWMDHFRLNSKWLYQNCLRAEDKIKEMEASQAYIKQWRSYSTKGFGLLSWGDLHCQGPRQTGHPICLSKEILVWSQYCGRKLKCFQIRGFGDCLQYTSYPEQSSGYAKGALGWAALILQDWVTAWWNFPARKTFWVYRIACSVLQSWPAIL